MNLNGTLIACAATFLLFACNQTTQPSGQINEGGHTDGHQQADQLATQWSVQTLATLGDDGLLQANTQVIIRDDILSVFYYDEHTALSDEDTARYDLKYLSWDLSLDSVAVQPEIVVSLDNSGTIAADFHLGPQVAYQGGNIRECQGSEQSDAMISGKLDQWQEETAAIGFVERTAPILADGLAGGAMSFAIDEFGHRHLVFQFYYEGCDQNPFAYPDLHYVSLLAGVDYGDPDNLPDEEQVDGNILTTDDDANFNKLVGTGDVNAMLLNQNQEPLVFYSAEDPNPASPTIGLKLAHRTNEGWMSEWLIEGCLVEGIDAATKPDGLPAVALYTTRCPGTEDFDPQLHYLEQTSQGWQKQTINMAERAGQYPALAFHSSGQPIIVFYELATSQNHLLQNLRATMRTDNGWQFSDVSNLDDVGQYNRLHVLESGEPVVVSYSASRRQILLFRPMQ